MSAQFIRPEVQEMLDTFAHDSDADLVAASMVPLNYDPESSWPQGGPHHPGHIGALQVEQRLASVTDITDIRAQQIAAEPEPASHRLRNSILAVGGSVVALATLVYGVYRMEVNAGEHRTRIAECVSDARGYQITLSGALDGDSGLVLRSDDPQAAAVKEYENAAAAQNLNLPSFDQRNSVALQACEGADGDVTRAREIIRQDR